jgi:hypothetical protein
MIWPFGHFAIWQFEPCPPSPFPTATPSPSTSPSPPRRRRLHRRGLAKAALAAKVDGATQGPLHHHRQATSTLAIITAPKPGQAASPDALALMRHSAAHVMAEAIQDVVGKDVLLAYGPPTDTGFFYDMFVPEGQKALLRSLRRHQRPHGRDHQGRSRVLPLRSRRPKA